MNSTFRLRATTVAATAALTLASGVLIGASPAVATPTDYRQVDTYPVGANPVAIAIDTSRHLAWIVNHGSATVTAFDTHSRSTVATVSVGNSPKAVAIDVSRGIVYVGDYAGGVTAIDESTRAVTETWDAVASSIDAVAVDPAARILYVADEQGETVNRLNLATGQPLAHRIHVGRYPTALSIDTAHHRLYVANGRSGADGLDLNGADTVVILSTVTGHALKTISGLGIGLRAIVVDPTTQLAYVGRSGSHGVAIVDGAAKKRLKSLSFGFPVAALALDAAAKVVLAGSGNSVAFIDARTHTLGYTSTLETDDFETVSAQLSSIAVNGSTHELYAPNGSADGTASDLGVYHRVLAPTFVNGAPPSGRVGRAYSFRFRATSQPAANYFGGAGLPNGLHLDATTGIVSGTPTKAGTFHFTIVASNPISIEVTKRFTIVVAP